jgi:hypothetical protein
MAFAIVVQLVRSLIFFPVNGRWMKLVRVVVLGDLKLKMMFFISPASNEKHSSYEERLTAFT